MKHFKFQFAILLYFQICNKVDFFNPSTVLVVVEALGSILDVVFLDPSTASSNFETRARCRFFVNRICPVPSGSFHRCSFFCSPFEYPFTYTKVIHTLNVNSSSQLSKFDYFGDFRVVEYLIELMVAFDLQRVALSFSSYYFPQDPPLEGIDQFCRNMC